MNTILPALIQIIAAVVLPILAGIWYAHRRRAPLVRPGCRACGTQRSFRALVLAEACDGCRRAGDQLGEPIALGQRSRKAAILPPAMLIAVGIGSFVASEALRAMPGVGGRPQQRPATIYADFLSSRRNLMSEYEDLLARERAGEDVVSDARVVLTGAIGAGPFEVDAEGAPIGVPSIATPSGLGPIDLATIALLGLPGSTEPPPEPDPDLARRVLHACFLPYRLDGEAFRRTGLIRAFSPGFEPMQSPIVRVLRVIACRVDGEPVVLVDQQSPASEGPLLLGPDRRLQVAPTAATESGATSERGTRVDLDCEELLFHRFDAERLRDLSGRVIPLERWPTPLATRRVTLTLDRVP